MADEPQPPQEQDEDYRQAGKSWRWRFIFAAILVAGVAIDMCVAQSSEPPPEANPEPVYENEQYYQIAEELGKEAERTEANRRNAIAQHRAAKLDELERALGEVRSALAREQDGTRRDELRAKLTALTRQLESLEAEARADR